MLASRSSTVRAGPTVRGRRGGAWLDRRPGGALVVDDHPSVRCGLTNLLAVDPGLAPVESAATAARAIVAAQRLRPAVAVVDYRLPGRDGLSLTLELKRLPEPPAVVVYSAFVGVRQALAASVAGADGIVDKAAGVGQLRVVVRAAASGERSLPRLPSQALGALTARLAPDDERIVAMMASGASPAQVARELEIDNDWLELRRWAIIRHLLAPGKRGSR